MANKNITGSKVSVNKIVFGEMILILRRKEKKMKISTIKLQLRGYHCLKRHG